ncbi:MAG: phytanoyl-CoA dioxygenase family protein [Acidobacteriota bacterium]
MPSRLRERFLRQGWLLLDPFLRDDEISELAREIDSVPRDSAEERGEPVVVRGVDRESDLLFDFARTPALLRAAENLLGKAVVPLYADLFVQPPWGSGVPPHQDQASYEAHFGDEAALSFWFAIDAAPSVSLEFSAEFVVALAPHRPSLTKHFRHELILDSAPAAFERVTLQRGGCLSYHSYAVHRIAPNDTSHCRRALSLTYRGSPYRERLAAGHATNA